MAILGDVIREIPPGTMLAGQIEPLIGLAEALYRLGDWDGATTHADLALSLAQDAGIVLGEGTTHAVASYVAAGRGSWETADALVVVAVQAAQRRAVVGQPRLRRVRAGDVGSGPRRLTPPCSRR